MMLTVGVWLFRPFAGLPPGLFAPGSFAAFLVRPLADLPPGLFIPWLVRPLADSPPGSFIIIIIIINGYPEAGRRPLFLPEVGNFNTNINKNQTNTIFTLISGTR